MGKRPTFSGLTSSFSGSGFPVVVSAPSGAGKTSLCRGVVEGNDGYVYSISVTSRPRLAVEREDKDYQFVTKEAFEEGIRRAEFIEWTEYQGSYYGTPREPLERALNEGKAVLLDLDINGARKMKKLFPSCVTIYVLAPSLKELENRLRGRARDPEEKIQARLESASEEMENIEEYDYVFVNDDFDRSVQRLQCIIEAETCRNKNWPKRRKVS